MIEFSYLKTNTCLICLTVLKVQCLTLLVHFYRNFTDRCEFCDLLLRCIDKERLPQLPASCRINDSPRCQITKLVRGMSLILQTCQQVSSPLQTEGPTALPPCRRRSLLRKRDFCTPGKVGSVRTQGGFLHNGVCSRVLTDIKPAVL